MITFPLPVLIEPSPISRIKREIGRGQGEGEKRIWGYRSGPVSHGASALPHLTSPYKGEEKRKAMKQSDQYHKWVEWSEEDQTYIGKCPDLITGIHGDNPVRLYSELCEVIEDVVRHFMADGRPLPTPRIRPMQEVENSSGGVLEGRDSSPANAFLTLGFQHDKERFRLSKDPEENRLAGMNRFEDFAKFPHGGHLDPIDFPDNVSFS